MSAVSAATGVSEEEIAGDRRFRRVVTARHFFFYLAYTMTKHSLREIAGTKHHTIVLHGVKKTKKMVASDPDATIFVRRLETQLEAR